jgi:hypothetical protein
MNGFDLILEAFATRSPAAINRFPDFLKVGSVDAAAEQITIRALSLPWRAAG